MFWVTPRSSEGSLIWSCDKEKETPTSSSCCGEPTVKLFSLPLPNYDFANVMNHNVSVCTSPMFLGNPCKKKKKKNLLPNLQWGHNPQVENRWLRRLGKRWCEQREAEKTPRSECEWRWEEVLLLSIPPAAGRVQSSWELADGLTNSQSAFLSVHPTPRLSSSRRGCLARQDPLAQSHPSFT